MTNNPDSPFLPSQPQPHPPPSSLSTKIQTLIYRTFHSFATTFDLHLTSPIPPSPRLTINIPSSHDPTATIPLYLYTSRHTSFPSATFPRPCVLNFHGDIASGSGAARDDARWCDGVASALDAIVVSVEYRLTAPEQHHKHKHHHHHQQQQQQQQQQQHYQPSIALEDAADALRWVFEHGPRYGVDGRKVVVGGFGAGGNLALMGLMKVWEEDRQQQHYRHDGRGGVGEGEEKGVKGVVCFYPLVELAKSSKAKGGKRAVLRFRKKWEGSAADETEGAGFSPALAEDQMVREALPKKIAMYTCGLDSNLVEEEEFRERLKNLGKIVDGFIIPDVRHGWDKMSLPWKSNDKREMVYQDAMKAVERMWK